jgi:inner membrane protein
MIDRLRATSLGVALVSSVDHYVMSARSTRYSVLFLLAVFAVVWLLEQRGKLRLHALQYSLVGAALCCFHLMILAFSEHVGFEIAYLAAAGMVTALVVYYSRAVLRSALRSAVVGCACLCVYAYLYVCLRNEDHALLIGSLGVFFGLAVVMALTRELDLARRQPVRPSADGGQP